MNSFRLSARAGSDLSDLHGYIAERNETAANNLLGELFDLFQLLAANPLSGQARDDLRPNLRSISHGSYVTFFYPRHDGVDIAAVIHGARDVEALFGD